MNVSAEGRASVAFRGHLDAQAVVSCWGTLVERLTATKVKSLQIDATCLESCDGPGLALLRYLNLGKMTPSATVSVSGLKEEISAFLSAFTAEDYEAFRPAVEARKLSLPEELGRATGRMAGDLREQVDFLGNITAGLAATVGHRKQMR